MRCIVSNPPSSAQAGTLRPLRTASYMSTRFSSLKWNQRNVTHVSVYSMAAPKVAVTPNRFSDFQKLELGRPTDRKQLVDDFPGFAVRCFLKESATAVQPFQDPTLIARFPAASYWDLIEKIHENNCRYVRLLSYIFIVRVAFSICLFLPLKFH
jgi:hypothetical protein